jgi:hypothetical protein
MNEKKETTTMFFETIQRVKALTPKDGVAFAMYVHALLHPKDEIGIAAGLEAAKHLDKEGGTMFSPMDCLLAALVTEYGLDTVTAWNQEQFEKALETLDLDAVRIKAGKVLDQNASFRKPKLTEEEITALILKNAPASNTKH